MFKAKPLQTANNRMMSNTCSPLSEIITLVSQNQLERAETEINKYLETPTLIDPIASKLVELKKPRISYLICKLRGITFYQTFLSTEPSLLLDLVEGLNVSDQWELSYCNLLHIHLLSKLPFNLSLFHSDLINKILNKANEFLSLPGKVHEASSLLIASLLSRPDSTLHLAEFTSNLMVKIYSRDPYPFLYCLAKILKTCKISPISLIQDKITLKSSHIRRLICKISTRTSLSLLKPRDSLWRYTKGSRITSLNSLSNQQHQQDDEDVDPPLELDDLIDILLTAISDKDTIVRWSAAKGIARVSARLSMQYSIQITSAILENFKLDDCAFHGACLALAELCRRGCILPFLLADIVPFVLKSLNYDLVRGTRAVGSHVRDAACYLCWSFARTFTFTDLNPYIQLIGSAMICIGLFDREVNIRRAGCAAFQENVGRLACFPNGIDIITVADYFSVGNKSSSYLEVAVKVASFESYRDDIINHLIEYKLFHWDKVIRQLAAQCLGKIALVWPNQVYSLLDNLVSFINSRLKTFIQEN